MYYVLNSCYYCIMYDALCNMYYIAVIIVLCMMYYVLYSCYYCIMYDVLYII